MKLDFFTELKTYKNYKKTYKHLLKRILKQLNLSFNPTVSVSIVGKEFIHKMNRDYRKIDRPTDVISFAFMDNVPNRDQIFKTKQEVVLGDIYICHEVAESQAVEYEHSSKREFCFLFIHGILHLLGYDHMTKEDETIMFKLQNEILKGAKL